MSDDTEIDRETMGRLAKALAFILGAEDPTTLALKLAAERGFKQDIAAAQIKFKRMKASDREVALSMIEDED